VKRLLARPPKLTLNSSFAEAYRSGRFTQLELMSDSELISEARKHDVTIRQETLEELDRYGAFTRRSRSSAPTGTATSTARAGTSPR
jgi:hypothetical protein